MPPWSRSQDRSAQRLDDPAEGARSRPTRGGASVLPAALLTAFVVLTSSASAASYGTAGVCSRLGYDDGRPLALGTGSYVTEDDEPVTAFVHGFNDDPAKPDPDVRALRRGGRLRGIALCSGDQAVARIPLPRNRRAGLTDVSANGRYVAWRTTSGSRGTLTVGVVRGRTVRPFRSSTSSALFGDGPRPRVRGQLLVTADGSVSWSLPVGTRAGVWLWPSGERPQRVALTRRDPVTRNASRDVRIVDRHHVLIGAGREIARYGPRTPGRCPEGLGVTTSQLGPLSIRYSRGASTEQFGQGAGWSHVLVCDPAVGDYTRVIPYASSSSGIGSSGDVSEGAGPSRAVFTAGLLVIEQTAYETGGGSTSTDYSSMIVPRDPLAPTRTIAFGGIAGPGVDPPPDPYDRPSIPSAPVAVRVAPGAVAWSEPSAAPEAPTIWLADAAGTRAVGTASGRFSPVWFGPTDPGLTLDSTEVTWNAPTGTARAPVTPTPDTTLQTAKVTG